MLAYLVNYNSSVPGLYIEAIVGIKCHILPSHMGEFFIQERHENITKSYVIISLSIPACMSVCL